MIHQPINPELASIHKAVEDRVYYWSIFHLVVQFAACGYCILASVAHLIPPWAPWISFAVMLGWGTYRIDLIMRLQRRPIDPAPKAGHTYRS